MDAIENLLTRRSVRRFQEKAVPKDVLEKIIAAGTYAPTGMNWQSPVIIAVTNKSLRDRISAWNAKIIGNDADPFYGAPAVLIVLADKTKPTYLYDGSLVMGNLLNAAHAYGVAGCWIHRAKEEFESEEGRALLKELGISGEYEGIGHCILGYAADALPEARPRKENYVYWAE